MALRDDLDDAVGQIFRSTWSERDGSIVPESSDVALGNEGTRLRAAILYADMADSTDLVDQYPATFAAEIYKAFLFCAAKIIRAEGGDITAYDGDRVMAVYIGDGKCTRAARTALKINYARTHIVNEWLGKCYPSRSYRLHHVVGIDTSEVLVARTGIRGANDLVWVGSAANRAAKLSALPHEWPSRVTEAVYVEMDDSVRNSRKGVAMWEVATLSKSGEKIYRSKWTWSV